MGKGESGKVKGSRGGDMTEADRQTKQIRRESRDKKGKRENCAWQTLLRDARVA